MAAAASRGVVPLLSVVVPLLRVAQGGLAIGDGLLESVDSRLKAGQLRRELRFALVQALDVGRGRSVVAPCLVEGGIGLGQLLREAIAIGCGLRELTIEMGLALGEIGGCCGQRGIVTLLRVAQTGFGIGNRLFKRAAGCAPLLDLLTERRFALGQALDVGSGRW